MVRPLDISPAVYLAKSTEGFVRRTEVANWLNVAALVATVFLLLSFCILPKKWTHGHYLSICLTIAVGFMEVHKSRTPIDQTKLILIACLHHSFGRKTRPMP